MHSIKGTTTYGRLLIGISIATLLLTLATAEVDPVPIKCFQCSSKDSNDCLDFTKLQAKVCSNTAATKCFTKNDAGTITRDCMGGGDCTGENCKTCDGTDACNNHNICKKCSTDDALCSQSQVTDIKYNSICDSSTTECFAQVKDKKVERRCAAAQDTCDATSTTCKKSAAALSNQGFFPAKRIQCYQCSGSECSDPSTATILAKPCANYVDNDQCYMTAESAAAVVRGCKSDDGTKCSDDAGDKSNCFTCSADSCNNSAYEKIQKLKCIQCEGDDCYKEQQASDAKDCKEKILYNAEESCITTFTKDGIYRGCLHDNPTLAEECNKDGTSCKKCNSGDGCNKEAEENTFTCIVCRSDIDKKCWNEADSTGQKCRTGESSAQEGCFHGIWNDVAIRGCVIDADEKTKATCLDANNHQCRVCYAKNCNKDKSSSAPQSVTIFTGLLVMMISAIWYLN
ncbi:protein psiQ [Stomoxys calcitrans]|uniref:protein psiQ n=1 Tax=Stomoxys calcitrans TaxID=35570 RepID=UPI0027E30071|nr:protein psiQ [Stomoxys calcitrans]